MKLIKILTISLSIFGMTQVLAEEVPLCALPTAGNPNAVVDNAKIEGDQDPGCKDVITQASTLQGKILNSKANDPKYKVALENQTALPQHIKVGTVYLQPITMSPNGFMRPRSDSDIHLEIDIHAQDNIKSSGFAPGDWLPNANITYSIQKIGESSPIACGFNNQTNKPNNETTCTLMSMAASDGAHYGDNVKLKGPGFYVITFNASSNPNAFGWHTDTDSKLLSTAYVDWKFKQSYIMKWTGIGKKGGY